MAKRRMARTPTGQRRGFDGDDFLAHLDALDDQPKRITDAEVEAWFAELEERFGNRQEARNAEAREQERVGREAWAKWQAQQETKAKAKKPRLWGTLAELEARWRRF